MKQQLEKLASQKATGKGEDQNSKERYGVNQDNEVPASDKAADAGGRAPDQRDKDTQSKEATNKENQTTTRIAHLELLQEFIKTELGYYLEIQTKVEKGSLLTIAFEDLWYIFRPGEVLYEKRQDHEQLLKVYSITGGQQRRRNRTPIENDRVIRERENQHWRQRNRYRYDSDDDGASDDNDDKDSFIEASGIGTWSPFTIDCYQIGFDGVKIGPIDSYRQIKHYSGECKITDLPVYPLRFHKRKEDIAAQLEARGRKFINSYGHKNYNGLTMPRTALKYQEELHGDIFIDLKTYYRVYARRRPGFGVLRTSRPDPRETDEHIVGEVDWRVLFDHEVDEKITDEYMAESHDFTEPVHFELVQDSPKHLQLLPYRIPAFVFRTRKYG